MATAPTSSAVIKAATPAEQLDKLAGLFTKYVNEHLMEAVNRMVAELLDISGPELDARAVFQRVKAGNLLKNNSYAYFHIASTGIDLAIRKELDLLLPKSKLASKQPPSALSLVPMEEMDRSVAFGSLAKPFEVTHSEILASLNVRLAFLLGRDILRMSQNPFRPDVLLMALYQSWCEFEPDAEAHEIVLEVLKPEVLFDLAPLLEEINESLSKKTDSGRVRAADNIEKSREARKQSKNALADQLRKLFNDEEAANEFGVDIPLIPDMPSMPKGEGGWRPSTASGFDVAPPAPADAPAHVVHHGHAPGAAIHGGAMHGTGQHANVTTGHAGGAYQGPAFTTGAGARSHSDGGHAMPGQAYAGHAMPGPVSAYAGHPSNHLLELLSKIQSSMPQQQSQSQQGQQAQAMASDGAAMSAPATPHSVFYLPRLKESLPQGSLSRGDESTIDLLSRIFETVFVDDSIPAETRELIQSLQVPVLKAALLDKNFFFQDAHPARKMIDLMSRMGWEQRKSADDPVFQAMQRSVNRVGQDFGQEVGVFAEAVAELEATIEADEEAAAEQIAEPIKVAIKQEKVVIATRSAKSAVALRVGSGDVVPIIGTFLENKWTTVLAVAYQVEEEKPGAVNNATRTMDELIWSVKPKVTQEQRRQLIAKLPTLLSMLNKWLDVIKWQDAERLRFFADLAQCHASIVRAPIDLSPERQLEIAVEVAQQEALRRIEQENALAAAEEAAVDDAVITVDGLERGMWLEFVMQDASVRKVKLAWVSPLRTLFIFSTGARQEAFSMSAEKLAEQVRGNKVSVIGQDGVVARALSQAMDEGAVNDPAMDLNLPHLANG